MIPARPGSLLRRNGVLYAIGLGMILCFKLYGRGAAAEALAWVLSPTAKWVEILTGIPFEKELYIGYVNHVYQIIIVPSCSGLRFMPVVFATLFFPFVHHIRPRLSRLCWLGASLFTAYGYTIFANGIRIALSIRLRTLSLPGPISPDLLHTMEGMAVYVIALCVVYQWATRLSRKWSGGEQTAPPQSQGQLLSGCAVPAGIYFALTLGVPLLRGEYASRPGHFLLYLSLMVMIFLAVALARRFLHTVRWRLKS